MTYTEETILDEARNHFEEKGIRIQFGARNMRQAIDNYNDSCLKCTMSHRCTGHQCSIERAFVYNTKKFQKELAGNPTLRQEVEHALALDA